MKTKLIFAAAAALMLAFCGFTTVVESDIDLTVNESGIHTDIKPNESNNEDNQSATVCHVNDGYTSNPDLPEISWDISDDKTLKELTDILEEIENKKTEYAMGDDYNLRGGESTFKLTIGDKSYTFSKSYQTPDEAVPNFYIADVSAEYGDQELYHIPFANLRKLSELVESTRPDDVENTYPSEILPQQITIRATDFPADYNGEYGYSDYDKTFLEEEFDGAMYEWEIADEEQITEIMSVIDEINEVKGEYEMLDSYEPRGGTPGYIIKTNGEVYEDMYFITLCNDLPNLSVNFADYNIPDEYISSLTDLITEGHTKE